jgi:hypothetical protein
VAKWETSGAILSAVVCASILAGPAAGGEVMGYRGDGSCVAEGNPPVRWGEGQNVLWRTPLPNWGYSSPIVARERVFVTTEPGWKHDFPVLNCFDAGSGRLLWQREVNQLPATGLSAERQEEVLREYRDILAKWRKSYRLFHEWHSAADAEGKKQALEKMASLGLKFDAERFQASYGVLRRADFPWKEFCFREAGFQSETWQHGCGYSISCVGQSFPTPVTDGEHVYVATAFMGFACYDLDGNLKWLKFSPGSYGGKWGVDYCKFARSPLLHGNLLISDMADLVRAFDKRTGELLWSHDRTGGKCTGMTLPAIITVDGTDVLISKSRAYRLPDGKELTVEPLRRSRVARLLEDDEPAGESRAVPLPTGEEVTARGMKPCGITRLVKHDERDVVFFTGGGEHGNWPDKGNNEIPPPMAVRFSLDGSTLRGEVLWSGINGQKVCGHTGIVYHDGKVYWRGCVLDAETGRLLAGTRRKRQGATPGTRHLLWVADGHVYGLQAGKEGEGICEVYTLDGERVAVNVLPTAKTEGEKADQIIEQTGRPQWSFSYACSFAIAGDRIYVRSNDDLWCIGRK